MAKNKKKDQESGAEENIIISGICKKYGNIIQSGAEVLKQLENYKVLSISPALDLALGGGLREGTCVNMTGDPKTGKEQPLSSLVYTPSGPKKMGDIKVGDKVCTPDGGTSSVIGVYPQGVKDIYKITFSDNSTAECGLSHLWRVRKNDNRNLSGWRTISLRDILYSGLKYSDRYKWKIPLTDPVFFEEKHHEMPAYILGCLIGDGGLTQGTPIITTADAEIHTTFLRYVHSLGLKLNHRGQYDYAISCGNVGGSPNPVTEILRKLGLMGKNSHEKFIPSEYKYGSITQRFALVRGLMDTDGYSGKKVAEYSTVSRDLAFDVREVLQSLGYTAKIKHRHTKCGGKEFPSYRIHISGGDISLLFSLARKKNNPKRTKPPLERTIVKVEKVRRDQCQCIMIDHPDHLYLTDEFIVTHNTTSALYFAAKAQQLGKKVYYLNTEGRLSKHNFDGIKGLNVEDIEIIQTSDETPQISAETYLNTLENLIKQEPQLVAIVDSVSNMIPQDELDGEIRTGVRNGLPRLLSMFFKRTSGDVSRMKSIVIFITHNIANTGGSKFSPAKMADSGNMLQYQVNTNMVITHRGKWEVPKESGNHVGQIANWKILTSAAGGRPNSTAESWIRYGIGIDEAQELAQLASQFALISCKGAWYQITAFIMNKEESIISDYLKENGVDTEDTEAVEKAFKFQGMENLVSFLSKNEDLQTFLMSKVKELML